MMRLIFNRVNRAINYVNVNRTLIAVFTHIYIAFCLLLQLIQGVIEQRCWTMVWRGRHGVVTTTSSCRHHDDVAAWTTTTTSPHRGTRGRRRNGAATTTSSCRHHDDVAAPTTTTTTSSHRGTRGRRRRRPRRHGAATSSARCVEVVVGQNPPTMMRWAKVSFGPGIVVALCVECCWWCN